jgi:hypothetical protein
MGLNLNPSQQAIVLCVDEKSQNQALDRSQPGTPLKKGCCGTITHDYERNDFAVCHTGSFARTRDRAECYERQPHEEIMKFLRHLDQEFLGEIIPLAPGDGQLWHPRSRVQAWALLWSVTLCPPVPSWLNLVERWFLEFPTTKASYLVISRPSWPRAALFQSFAVFWPRFAAEMLEQNGLFQPSFYGRFPGQILQNTPIDKRYRK